MAKQDKGEQILHTLKELREEKERQGAQAPGQPEETKSCSRCGNVLPATTAYFNTDKRAKTGLTSWCKSCLNEKYNEKRAAETSASGDPGTIVFMDFTDRPDMLAKLSDEAAKEFRRIDHHIMYIINAYYRRKEEA